MEPPPVQRIGWRRWLAGGIMALAGLTAPGDLVSPDDPIASAEASLEAFAKQNRLAPQPLLASLRALPGWPESAREGRWRAATRQAHRVRESARALAAGLGALALAFGILARKRWAARLLGLGLLLWTGLYLFDLWDGRRFLGNLPSVFAAGQGLNLLCILGLWLWLRKAAPT